MENTMTMVKSCEQKMLERRSELFEQARGDEALEKRRENIKQFHLGHGRYQAVVFPEPVHYQEDGDGWKDIDNNLDDATDAAGRPILRNRANARRVELSKSADSGKLARIESGGHVLEWSLDGMPTAVAPVVRQGAQIKQARLVARALFRLRFENGEVGLFKACAGAAHEEGRRLRARHQPRRFDLRALAHHRRDRRRHAIQ